MANATDALGAGWIVNGSGANWYAELPVQGGKVVAVAAASASLWAAIQSVEDTHGRFKSGNSPRDSSWKGAVV